MAIIDTGNTVLFQGDSVTDCGRKNPGSNELGQGYAFMASGIYKALNPEKDVTFINRGNSGNRVANLLDRWQEDCIDLEPDVITILIGINNVWRGYDSGDPTPLEVFEEQYRKLIEWTKKMTRAEIILLEPFVLPVPEDRKEWRKDLDPKLDVIRRIAGDFELTSIPLDWVFTEAIQNVNPEYWAPDGVHPSLAGHGLIANELIKIF